MNKYMKKFIAIIALVGALCQNIAFAAFCDVDSRTEQGQAIMKLADRNIVNGMGNGYFQPDGALTRGQFVKIVNKVFGYTHQGENRFSDVASEKWYYADVCIAADAGYIDGIGNGLFAPEDFVTREQACVILDNILGMEIIPYYKEPKDEISAWARDAVIKALSNRLINSEPDGRLRATELMTRGEACEMLAKCVVDDVGKVDKIDLNAMARDELEIKMNRVIAVMEKQVIPELTDEKSIQVGQMVVLNMKNYIADESHDYVKASQDTFEVYKTIPAETRAVFKNLVQQYNKIEDLMLLYEFFYIA